MSPRRELGAFAVVLAILVAGLLHESLFGGKVLSPADLLFVSASFRERGGPAFEPANRLLTDPVFQFQPWLEFNRSMIRRGRLPLWNDLAGCGAPHLANGQSAVFDPFHVIAYVGELPQAYSWMAAARLVIAGLGMFVLARAWGLGPWGRWFAGLTFPFSGFLILWLLYPVTSAAVWMPWLLWASDRVLREPSSRRIGLTALFTGLVLLGGHVQTSAHVLLAAGAYALVVMIHGVKPYPKRTPPGPPLTRGGGVWLNPPKGKGGAGGGARGGRGGSLRGGSAWLAGVFLGVALAAIEVVPLGFYLSKSPVWQDRARERRPPWVLSRPRWLDACCTALPYVFGSQRRGQPHLGRALGVHNLNESAGGFAGLATLVWLAPWGWWGRRRDPRVGYLAGLVAIGAMGAFGVPPVDNLLRALPVLSVMDNRRLTLWVAFGLVLLGGLGLDALSRPDRPRARRWGIALAVAAAIVLLVGAMGVRRAESWLRPRALRHYAEAASATPGADPSAYRQRAERQVRQTLDFVPNYLGLASAQFLTLAALAWIWGRGPRKAAAARLRPALMGLTFLDLFAFGFGLNPAIGPEDDRPETPVIAHLRQTVGTSGRIVGLGEELPPNTLMRYGLADVRNYDSVELTRSLAWLAPLYEPGPSARTSRREVTWAGVVGAEDRLREAGVRAVVAPSSPPKNIFIHVNHVGEVWVARLDGSPLVEARHPQTSLSGHRAPGEIRLIMRNQAPETVVVRETFDPGWSAEIDGHDATVEPYRDAFLAVRVPPGSHRLLVRYDPPEVRVAVLISMAALLAIGVFALTDFRPYRLLGIVGPRAWKDSSHRGTIGAVIFTGHSKRLTTEG